MTEQFKFDNEGAARDCASDLAKQGKHGSIILSDDRGEPNAKGYARFFVETEPVGMIRSFEEELTNFGPDITMKPATNR